LLTAITLENLNAAFDRGDSAADGPNIILDKASGQTLVLFIPIVC